MTDRSHAPTSNLESPADRALHAGRELRAIPGNPQHSAIQRDNRRRLDRNVCPRVPSPPREVLSRRLVPAAAITFGFDTLCSAEAWAGFTAGFTASAQQRLGLRRLPGHRGSGRQQLSADDCDQWREVTIEDVWLDRTRGEWLDLQSHQPAGGLRSVSRRHSPRPASVLRRAVTGHRADAPLRLGLSLHRGLWHGLSLL